MTTIGFTGENYTDCSGCVENCIEDQAAGGNSDTQVLQCFSSAQGSSVCSVGIIGAMPFVNAVNSCCIDATESVICTRLCTALISSEVASAFFVEGCASWE
jgi:hypothetical protein